MDPYRRTLYAAVVSQATPHTRCGGTKDHSWGRPCGYLTKTRSSAESMIPNAASPE